MTVWYLPAKQAIPKNSQTHKHRYDDTDYQQSNPGEVECNLLSKIIPDLP